MKLCGEEGQIVCQWETLQDQDSRRVSRWLRQASTTQETEWAKTVRDDILSAVGDRPAQIRQFFTQGGDKFRLTLITNITRRGWFDPDCEKPYSYPVRYGLIVKSNVLCALADITDDHKWARTHTVMMPDETLKTRLIGTSTKGALCNWVEARRSNPDHVFWEGYAVFGQASAWVCSGMAVLYQHFLAGEVPGGAMTVCDCLGSQWSEPALFAAWDNQIAQFPIPPNATAYMQGPDTHLHGTIKPAMRDIKAGEIAAKQTGTEYSPNRGPPIFMELLAKIRERVIQHDQKRDMSLTSGMGNQTFIFRPNEEGHLKLVDE